MVNKLNMTPTKSLKSHATLKPEIPLTPSEIDDFQKMLGVPLPNEIRELLGFARGYHSENTDSVDFTGKIYRGFCEAKDILIKQVPLNKTETGDFWAVDIDSTGRWGAVFYLSHDPPIVLVQFESLSEFIVATATRSRLVDDKMITEAMKAQGISIEEAKTSSDRILKDFAATLPERSFIFDLRLNSGLNGFQWHPGNCFRCGDERVFAVEKYVQSKSWFSRLFET